MKGKCMQQERPVDITNVLREIQGPSNEEMAFRKEIIKQEDEKYFEKDPSTSKTKKSKK